MNIFRKFLETIRETMTEEILEFEKNTKMILDELNYINFLITKLFAERADFKLNLDILWYTKTTDGEDVEFLSQLQTIDRELGLLLRRKSRLLLNYSELNNILKYIINKEEEKSKKYKSGNKYTFTGTRWMKS